MAKYCFQNQPVDNSQLIFGLLIFVGFFGLVCYCQKSGAERRRFEQKQKKQSVKSKPQMINYNFKDLKKKKEQQERRRRFKFIEDNEDEEGMDIQLSQQQDNQVQQEQQNGMIEMMAQRQLEPFRNAKSTNINETVKRLSSYAYDYAKNQHLVTKSFRSEAEIKKQTNTYLTQQQKKPESPQKKQSIKVEENQSKSGIKRVQSASNLMDLNSKKQVKNSAKQPEKTFPATLKPKQSFPPPINPKPYPTSDQKKQTMPDQKIPSIFPSISPNTNQAERQQNNSLFPTKPLFTSATVPTGQQKTPSTKQEQPPKQPQKPSKQTPKQPPQPPQQPLIKPEQNNPPKKTDPLFPSLNPTNPQKPQPKSGEGPNPASGKTTITKIDSSLDYLKAIINYSETFGVKAEISTNISNLNGARSDPKQLWLFASGYIKTINPNNHNEVLTFSYRIWDAVVNKFIKNTNIKDGFQRLPPKEKNKQVEKNSINTYVLLINIFRVMGFEAVWLGVFGKTLKMLSFLFERKETIKKWEKLQLYQMKYVTPDGDISSKYQSRIDFLTYFLLALTTLDPVQAFEEISQKTNEQYPFIDQLKRYKHKWSYRQFWCLIDVMKKNPIQAYFKIPFWTNAQSVIYLQLLKSLKSNQMKQFELVYQFIIKQIKQHTKKFEDSQETKNLQKEQFRDRGKGFQFDGDQFVNGIKTLGRGIDTREREIKLAMRKWEDFRDKCSILYYFWRRDTL